MYTELYFFIFLAFVALYLALFEIRDSVYYPLSFIMFLLFSIVVRYSGYEIDLYKSYEPAMHSVSHMLYYLKEPVYWFGSRYLYQIVPNHHLVFTIFDMLCFIILLYVQKSLRLPKYFPFVFIGFFPLVLGMQNSYRQFIASFFLLLTVSYAFNGKVAWKYFSFLFALLSHNSSILLMPLVFIFKGKTKRVSYLFHISMLFITVLAYFFLNKKFFETTGDVDPLIFTIVIVSIYVLYFACMGRLTYRIKPEFYIVTYLSFLTVFVNLIASGGVAKRVGMICLMLSLVFIVKLIDERFKQKKLIRITLIVIVFGVSLAFPATWGMLTGVNSVFVV